MRGLIGQHILEVFNISIGDILRDFSFLVVFSFFLRAKLCIFECTDQVSYNMGVMVSFLHPTVDVVRNTTSRAVMGCLSRLFVSNAQI